MSTKKATSHRRNDSGELDVFEAARYFSGYNDNFALVGGGGGANMNPTKVVIKEEKEGYLRGIRRISLDIPSLKHHQHYNYNHPNSQQPQQQQKQQQQQQIKDKKHKQPSSPGGKLAHFLNSLFSQTSSRKKKSSSKSISTQSMKDYDDESPNGRRKRRSSMSNFQSTSSSSVVDAKSIYSTSNSGFRTPPHYCLNTPIKSYKDFRSFCDHKEVLATFSNYNINGNANANANANGNGKNDNEKSKFKNNGVVVEKPKMINNLNNNQGYQDQKKREINKVKEELLLLDDGAESDSSSDLFELQIDNNDFEFCSSGLPVYETTHMDSIKRSSATRIN